MLSSLSAAMRLLLFVVWTFVMLPPYLATLALGRYYRRIARVYWAVTAKYLIQAEIVCRGTMSGERPLLIVANHASYLDIVVLGATVPGCFVSKAEVRKWPGIGFLAIIARTVFVDRRPSSTHRQRDEIAGRLKEGEPLILFPEGTSSDGNRVLPFKSALFNAAEHAIGGRRPVIQPLAIAYTRQGGLPVGYAGRPLYAWYGDMDLVTHLWAVMKAGPFTVELEFLPTVTMESFPDRKALARHCEDAVRRAVSRALSGRTDTGSAEGEKAHPPDEGVLAPPTPS